MKALQKLVKKLVIRHIRKNISKIPKPKNYKELSRKFRSYAIKHINNGVELNHEIRFYGDAWEEIFESFSAYEKNLKLVTKFEYKRIISRMYGLPHMLEGLDVTVITLSSNDGNYVEFSSYKNRVLTGSITRVNLDAENRVLESLSAL